MMIIRPQGQVNSQDSNSSYLLPFTHGIMDFFFFKKKRTLDLIQYKTFITQMRKLAN